MDKNFFIGEPPTGTVYIGYDRGTWPMVVFANAEHAANWLGNETTRVLWRYELIDPVAMTVVPKVVVNATLKEKEAPNGAQPA